MQDYETHKHDYGSGHGNYHNTRGMGSQRGRYPTRATPYNAAGRRQPASRTTGHAEDSQPNEVIDKRKQNAPPSIAATVMHDARRAGRGGRGGYRGRGRGYAPAPVADRGWPKGKPSPTAVSPHRPPSFKHLPPKPQRLNGTSRAPLPPPVPVSKPQNFRSNAPHLPASDLTSYSRDDAPPNPKRRKLSHEPKVTPVVKAEDDDMSLDGASTRSLVTAGTKWFNPLPRQCHKSTPNWPAHRQLWFKTESQALRARGFQVLRSFFRDDGMVIDWTSPRPVWSDTLEPDSRSFSLSGSSDSSASSDFSIASMPSTSSFASSLDCETSLVTPEPFKSDEPIPTTSSIPPSRAKRKAPPLALPTGIELGAHLAPEEPRQSSSAATAPPPKQKRTWKKKKHVPQLPNFYLEEVIVMPNPELQSPSPDVPQMETIDRPRTENSNFYLEEIDYIPPPSPQPAADGFSDFQEMDVIKIEDEEDYEEADQPLTIPERAASALPSVPDPDLIALALDYLRLFIKHFDKDRTRLVDAYTDNAILSCSIVRDKSLIVSEARVFSGCASDSLQVFGPSEISRALQSFGEHRFYPYTNTPFNADYDVLPIGDGQLLLMMHGQVVSDTGKRVALDSTFLLTTQRDPDVESAWPLLALSHQMVLRDSSWLPARLVTIPWT